MKGNISEDISSIVFHTQPTPAVIGQETLWRGPRSVTVAGLTHRDSRAQWQPIKLWEKAPASLL